MVLFCFCIAPMAPISRAVDFNLLIVLDALLDERSVTPCGGAPRLRAIDHERDACATRCMPPIPSFRARPTGHFCNTPVRKVSPYR